ncbi:hypothetical protein [Algibacter pectinivorans]|uniref:Uncharacterized protein n=1 Tax=Algibacter pectinivorans TaxID=870482 RepID=A0A1I1MYU2_9FLAO|nr:hypothetical protein [Algibacter pectinivorans]SFC88418.1 hypothetical protein SAMN04487987_101506 [Algibacter pectinivorans]
MIITKVLGLTSALTRSKKAKITILLIEVAVLAHAVATRKKDTPKKIKK